MLQSVKYGVKNGAKYASELLHNSRSFAQSLRTFSENSEVSHYLATHRIYSSSAMGLLGLMFYDMAIGENLVIKDRELVGRTASRIILLTDIVDDVIDKRSTSLEEKFTFLDNVKSDLFGYSCHSSLDLEEDVSYHLARGIYTTFLFNDQHQKVEKIFDTLVDAIKRQFIELNEDELLHIAKTIGSCCTDTTAVLTEIVTGKNYFSIRESARKFGEYCELLDNYYELDNDLVEGVNTFPTVRIRNNGNISYVRKDIKSIILTLANESFTKGFENLSTEEQKSTYLVLKWMVDLKYKVIDRVV